MKRILSFYLCIFFLLFVSLTFACSLYPVIDGYDVLVPDLLIQEIPNYDPQKPVYAATDINGWFVRGDSWATAARKKQTEMTQTSCKTSQLLRSTLQVY